VKIAVSGGAGFIGSQVVAAYLDVGHEVLVVDDLSTGSQRNLDPRAAFTRADIRSEECAARIRGFAPEVLNLHAAQIDVRASVRDPRRDADINVGGTVNLLEAARAGGRLRRVVYAASGGSMYGDAAPVPASETAPAAPASFYGVSKFAGELYLRCFQALHGIHHVALRYSNVYGPRQSIAGEAGVVAIFTERLLRGTDCTIYGDGGQTRDFVYVGDVVDANVKALTCEFHGGVNIGTSVETDVLRLYRLVCDAVGVTREARFAPPRTGEQRRSALDRSLARQALGWEPTTTLQQGLARAVAWYREIL
jgi:UDP-glucose 4-epimerase